MKREKGYLVKFITKDQKKISLTEYTSPEEETVVSWNNGRKKKSFKGENGFILAGYFIRTQWPDRRVIWTNFSKPPA